MNINTSRIDAILPDSPDVFVVLDARQDIRFSSHPLVTGPPYIRFYAGAAILVNDIKVIMATHWWLNCIHFCIISIRINILKRNVCQERRTTCWFSSIIFAESKRNLQRIFYIFSQRWYHYPTMQSLRYGYMGDDSSTRNDKITHHFNLFDVEVLLHPHDWFKKIWKYWICSIYKK